MTTFVATLPPISPSEEGSDWARAQRHLPVILFDRLEPFLPVAVGYTVFRQTGNSSSSFKREVSLPEGCAVAIEYAVWWDWDIQHLYELEHLWVYLDTEDNLIGAEGSAHGGFHPVQTEDGELPTENGRLRVYSEPGKHAFAGSAEQLQRLEAYTNKACGDEAGQGDVLINDMFQGHITASGRARRLCKRYMSAHAFVPSYDFSLRCDLRKVPLVSWDALRTWIPKRVTAWLDSLSERLPQVAAVLLDCGDTLVDEGTEVKDRDGIVTAADLIPGAKAMLEGLSAQGHRVALVADGQVDSFATIFSQHDLEPYFETKAISEAVGVDKPDARMFDTALTGLGLSPEAYARVVMVGNHLGRDVKGANALGIRSIWLDWAPRRAKVPADETEVPSLTISKPLELLDILEELETSWARKALDRTQEGVTAQLEETHG